MRSAILDYSASHIVVQEHSTGLQSCTERTSSLRIIHITKFAQIIFDAGSSLTYRDYHQLEPQVQIKLKDCYIPFTVGKPAVLYAETNPDWVPSLKIGCGTNENSEVAGASVCYHRK